MPLGQPLSQGFQISNFLAILYIYIYHIKQISKQSLQWLVRCSPDKNFSGFGHARGPALESDFLNFETLLQNLHPYVPYPQISEQSGQWLSRTRPDKFGQKEKAEEKEEEKEEVIQPCN